MERIFGARRSRIVVRDHSVVSVIEQWRKMILRYLSLAISFPIFCFSERCDGQKYLPTNSSLRALSDGGLYLCFQADFPVFSSDNLADRKRQKLMLDIPGACSMAVRKFSPRPQNMKENKTYYSIFFTLVQTT
jgi:hypothetical protein